MGGFAPKFKLWICGVPWMAFLSRNAFRVRGEGMCGGYCAPSERWIKVQSGFRGMGYRLIEEVGHAVCDCLEINDDDKETHNWLRRISAAIESFIGCNPGFCHKLVDYIAAEWRSKNTGRVLKDGPCEKYPRRKNHTGDLIR